MEKCFQILSKSEIDTKNIAKIISPLFHEGDLIILEGDLGSGKTHFVKGFAEGTHSQDAVTSPTFSIANFYRSTHAALLHIDLYRIESTEEFNDLGLAEYFDQSVTLVEWGKKFSDCFESYLLITFELQEDGCRLISFTSEGEMYNSKIDRIKDELINKGVC